MDQGAVFATFIVVFREALEASLILGIILTVLVRLKGRHYTGHVFASSALAILASWGAGQWLSSLADSAQDRASQMIEGMISLVAAGVLTYMFFWMERQARRIKSEIEARVETALSTGDYFAMVSLPFFAVFREGAETVLFLKAVTIQNGGNVSFFGGISGFFLALGIAAAIFIGGRKIPLRPLFRGTGVVILLLAAGLLAYGIHEFEELGWAPSLIHPLYNINPVLNEKEGLGSFLKALFGYNGDPSLTEVVAYWSYLGAVILFFLKGERTVH